MPPKSKRQAAAERREARKAENVVASTAANAYIPPQYKPQDPSLQPYWDAFYENPYPNAEERKILSERLNMSLQTIQQWFIMARRFTYAPDKKSDNDDPGESEVIDMDMEESEEEVSIEGTLYRYFYQDVITQKSNARSELKRKLPDDEATRKDIGSRRAKDMNVVQSKSTHQRGPRGPYTKQSETSLWRRAKHARQYASPIHSYFPVVNRATKKPRVESSTPPDQLVIRHIVVTDSESESEQVEHSATSSKVIEGGNLDQGATQCASSAAPGGTSEVSRAGKDVDSVALENYHSALKLLELSMDRLKLDALIPIEPPLDNQQALMSKPTEPPSPRVELASIAINEAESSEEGPTLQEAEEATLDEPVDVDLLEGADEDERDEPFDVALGRHLKRLLGLEKKSKKPNMKRLIELTMLSDYNNLRKVYINTRHKSPSILASNRIAEAKFVPTPTKPTYQHESWFARQLRVKAYHLVRFGSLPESNRGRGASHYSILCEEDVRRSILTYLRTLKTGTISPLRLRRAVNQEIFPQLGITLSISESTARRWILKLGYRPVRHSKGMYMDGHERSDVVEYRNEFLELIKAVQP
ncbi:homeobox KN domain protein, partial [Rhizoctonia solani AG-3 Rhs1AP]